MCAMCASYGESDPVRVDSLPVAADRLPAPDLRHYYVFCLFSKKFNVQHCQEKGTLLQFLQFVVEAKITLSQVRAQVSHV